jgi:Uma2 family endonuclease
VVPSVTAGARRCLADPSSVRDDLDMSILPAVDDLQRRPIDSLSRRERERLLEAELDPTLSEDEQKLVTEDDTPVDNILSEKQMRLLTEALYASWSGPPPGPDGARRSFVAYANVGLYIGLNQSPLVPDVLVSLDVEQPEDFEEKRDRVYFAWRFGKLPDLVLEIVSNKEGGELSTKRDRYASLLIPLYVVFDPFHQLGPETLRTFELRGGRYEPTSAPFYPSLGLGVTLWRGRFEDVEREWLRWCDEAGKPLPTGVERAEEEARHAQKEKQRADRLAAKLRALGIDPDDV